MILNYPDGEFFFQRFISRRCLSLSPNFHQRYPFSVQSRHFLILKLVLSGVIVKVPLSGLALLPALNSTTAV